MTSKYILLQLIAITEGGLWNFGGGVLKIRLTMLQNKIYSLLKTGKTCYVLGVLSSIGCL